ncbi:AAA family ATPase [Phormidium tenue FACHB-886]|nr:AAA family ATPase [Phormidium tenue FACHB-886]
MLGNLSLPGYSLHELVHEGAATLLYRALSHVDQQPVILKISKTDCPTPEQTTRLQHEYQIARTLDSSQLVKVYRLEIHQHRLVLVAEDFGGQSLRDCIRQPLTLLPFLSIATQLATALLSLHQHQIIHKNIKPSNIIFNARTGQVKLTNFSIASRLSQESLRLTSPNQLEGTLAYLSPEQTGRMNRSLDYRTDFYSLGVTFYELLTGQLPFQSNDPLEMVYQHIAKEPISIQQLNPAVSDRVAAIVGKLMAKNAEDRYQSAEGLLADCQRCLSEFKGSQRISNFEVGKLDTIAQLNIPQKLYGRETQVAQLLAAFDRVRQGERELVVVAGYSGIGKTALIHELYKPVTRSKAHFISGKFDQFKREVPHACVAESKRGLIQQILSESQENVSYWRSRFLEAVGQNGQVVVDVIPELELLIGKQPTVPDLPAAETQNRFYQTFGQFLLATASQDYPEVEFMDDVQWIDAASLAALRSLMNHPENHYRLIILAYRDNEVDATHPFIQTLEQLKTDGVRITHLALDPLSCNNVTQFVADALNSPAATVQPLAELLYAKTQGNPFFLAQLLKSLHANGWLTFDYKAGAWQWDIEQICQQNITDNVVELMVGKLQQLSEATQKQLQLAACIGNQFDLQTLATVSEQSAQQTMQVLWAAVQQGFVLPLDRSYRAFFNNVELFRANLQPKFIFLHDRVQQAAYELIPDSEKQATHLKIGRLLLQSAGNLEANIFEIVNHWNAAIDLIWDAAERVELATLNLTAGRKAKVSAAHEPALKAFKTGLQLLTAEQWQTHYELMLSLHEGAAEAAYLCGEFEQMEQWSAIVLQQGKTVLDKVKVYDVRVQTYMAQARPLLAIQVALEALSLLGISLPESPSAIDIQQKLAETKSLLSAQQIPTLVNLPPMMDAEKVAAIALLSSIFAPSFAAKPELLALIACEQVQLSIRYGNCAHSAFGYSNYAAILNAVSNDLDAAYQFGQLAIHLAQQLDAKLVKARTFNQAAIFSMHGRVHLQHIPPLLQEACQSGLESGDLEFAGYAAYNRSQYFYFAGLELNQLQQEAQAYSNLLKKLNLAMSLSYNQIVQQVALNLLGKSDDPCRLVGTALQEEQALAVYEESSNQSGMQYLFLHKLILSYLFSESEHLLKFAERSECNLRGATGMIMMPTFYFYAALSWLSLWAEGGEPLQLKLIKAKAELLKWAKAAPVNFQHKFDLVMAEHCRVLKEPYPAMDYYDRAIAGAIKTGYIQEAAIANERAAEFYFSLGKTKVAQIYLVEASQYYQQWGAIAKVNQLKQKYPEWLQAKESQPEVSPADSVVAESNKTPQRDLLDLATVMKAAEAISSELALDRLLENLLHIILENAAAQKGCIILERDRQLFIEVADTDQQETVIVLQSIPVETSRTVPVTLIQYVARTQHPLVLSDAIREPISAVDPYVQETQPKSILCAPILYQGKFIGLVYLENNLATGAFTHDRLQLIQMLTTQAAIAIENARLYAREQEKINQLKDSLEALQQSELLKRQLFEGSADAILLLDQEQFSECNQAAVKMMRCTNKAELLGCRPAALSPEFQPDGRSSLEKANEMIATAFKEGSHRFEWVHRRITGEDFWVEVLLTVISYDGREILHTVWREIGERKQLETERNRAEAEIKQKSIELEQALINLQNTQAQLIHTEKISALGQLVAGVAHEINNPVSFISGNLHHAKQYVNDLLNLVELYQRKLPVPDTEIAAAMRAIDLQYLAEDLPKMIASMKLGTDRIYEIMQSLRHYSRQDGAEKQPTDIHKGLESTLIVLSHRLKANSSRPAITVIKQYEKLPKVLCFSGQLNQVFMNLIANAIDALEESNVGKTAAERSRNANTITLQTALENNYVVIRIADNGTGMSEVVKQKLFTDFFTTKPEDKGTGLGLPISRQIVEEKHAGRLEVESEIGRGTVFKITLPIGNNG